MSLTFTTTLTRTECGHLGCGIPFAMPEWLFDRANADHGISFYCPNGHQLHFVGPTIAEQLQRDLATTTAILGAERDARARESERKNREIAGLRMTAGKAKAKLARVAHRVANGVCPECHRSFQNLRRHMASQHQP